MRKPISGRPEGTDGSDYSFRMTVDPRYTKVTKLKARLKIVIFLQCVIQLLGVLYVFSYLPAVGALNPLTVSAVLCGTVIYSTGEIGRRRNLVMLLKAYRSLSFVATLTAVASTARHTTDYKLLHGSKEVVWMGMTAHCIFSYSLMVLGVMVEAFQVYTTSSLLHNMSPPKRN